MRIERYCVKDLPALIATDFFKKTPVLPISVHRAMSHFHNPRALPQDEILYLMFIDDSLVAYRLLLPDCIHFQGKKIRMAWVSCIWVDPKMRGRGYAQQLTALGLEAWNNCLMGTEFAPASRSMYKRMGMFEDFREVSGYRAYVRLDTATLIPKRRPALSFLKPILKIIDGGVSALQNINFRSYNKALASEIAIEETNLVDAEAWTFISTRQGDELMRRNQEELNWLLQHPWVLTTDTAKENAARFHFTSAATRFEQSVIKIHKNQTLIAVLIWTIRDKMLKVPYAYFDKNDVSLIAQYLTNILIEKNIYTFTIFHPELCEYFKQTKTPFLKGRDFTRHYMYAKGFPRALKEEVRIFQDGDGDAGFT